MLYACMYACLYVYFTHMYLTLEYMCVHTCIFHPYVSTLGAISFISIGCITLITVLVVIAGPIYGIRGYIQVFNISGMFQKLGSIIFALSCTSATFHAYGSTKDATPLLWKRIMSASTVGGSFLCCLMGLAGVYVRM